MEVQVLGPVQVISDGRQILRARRRERLLLGLLALEANHPIQTARLERLLWDDDAPKHPRQVIRVYVSRLRSQLEGSEAAPVELASHGSGYVLRIDPERVDALRFEAAVAAARKRDDPGERASAFAAALALWRGPLLDDAADELLRDRIGLRLAELRLTAEELRVEAELAAGNHEALLPELAQLTDRFPLREKLIAARMTALHRSSRSLEALELYQTSSAALREQSGLDFSDDLKAAYVAILRADELSDAGTATVATVPAQLPADLAHYVGRHPELRMLTEPDADGRRGRARVFAVDGMAGVGKTALVVHAAHRVRDRFPDGQLHVNLHGFTRGSPPVEPTDVLDGMLRALGTPTEQIPRLLDDRAAAFRSIVADRRFLIVLDNAVSESQVEPLLPATEGCLVFLTSRHRLSGLDDARFVSLSPLAVNDSMELFRRTAGADRVGGGDVELAAIVGMCGNLPLAVRIAAARLRDQPQWTIGSLMRRLRDGDAPLTELTVGHRGVTAALELSYRHLDPLAQRMFRLLGLAPAMPLDAEAAAALADTTPRAAEDVLSTLVNARMLDSTAPDRYQFHDLTKQYAFDKAEHNETDDSRRAAFERLVDHHLNLTRLAAHRIYPAQIALSGDAALEAIPDHAAALAWLDERRHQLRAIIVTGSVKGLHEQVWNLCARLSWYYRLRGHHEDWLVTHEAGLRSATALDDDRARALILNRLVLPYRSVADFDRSRECAEEAAELFDGLGEDLLRAAALNNLGWIVVEKGDRTDADAINAALGRLDIALELCVRNGDPIGQSKVRLTLGDLCRMRDRHAEALEYYGRALEQSRRADQDFDQGLALYGIGLTHVEAGDHASAIEPLTEALRLSRQAGATANLPGCLERLADAYLALGQLAEAQRCQRELESLRRVKDGRRVPSAVGEGRV